MLRLRLYLETTTFNWYFDERKGHEDVVRLFEAIRAGQFVGYTSRYVTDELEKAAEPKKSKMMSLIDEYGINMINRDDKAEALAERYIADGVIPASHFYDSIHVAISSVHGLDAIVSYNFHHINRVKTVRLSSIINKSEGYKAVMICTAEEVFKYGGTFGRDGSYRG